MGHDKLRKFRENETFKCLLQPDIQDVMIKGEAGFTLKSHPVAGHWNETMFAQDRPIVLELGCGKGDYTVDLSRRKPEFNYIGVDIKGARLWKGAKYATQNALPNVAFLRTRIEFISAFFAPGEVSEIWLTFSDPQMKSENSRLTSAVLLERYSKFLKPGGIIHLKTDSMFLYQYSKAVAMDNGLRILASTEDLYGQGREKFIGENPDFSSVCGEDAVDALYGVQTFYERMFLDMGLSIKYLSFVIDHNRPLVSPRFDNDYWKSVEGKRRSFGHGSNEEE